nr:MAG TPA: hypothetical protein [Caudoviricetes sp.]
MPYPRAQTKKVRNGYGDIRKAYELSCFQKINAALLC